MKRDDDRAEDVQGSGGGGPVDAACVRALLVAHHRQWTPMIVSTLVSRRHDPDDAMEASQMAFVELWMRPERFNLCKEAAIPPEDRLFFWLRRRAMWRGRDLRRAVSRELPSGELTVGRELGANDRPARIDDPADVLLEPDEQFWIAMNTTVLCHRPNCHPEAIACCLSGETQRTAAEKFNTSASTLNRHVAFFKARYALLGPPGRATFDVQLVRELRRRGIQLVVMLRDEVERDATLSPRVPCWEGEEQPAWICEVTGASSGGG